MSCAKRRITSLLYASYAGNPSTASSDLAQQRDAEDVLQQKRDGADG